MPRKPHDYHYIYKTTNLINQKFYIGMHSTSNLDDQYLGSGKYLWNSIRKYGRENFEIEILEWYDTRNELPKREREIVTKEFLKNEMCMNLAPGGGGQVSENITQETRLKLKEIWTLERKKKKSMQMSGSGNPRYGKEKTEEELIKIRLNHADVSGKNNPMFGVNHTDETRKKISETRKLKISTGEIKIIPWNKGIIGKSYKKQKLYQYDDNRNLIKIWDYVSQAAIELNLSRNNIFSRAQLNTNKIINNDLLFLYKVDKNKKFIFSFYPLSS